MHWLKKRWWVVIIGVVLLAVIGFIAWGMIIPEPMPEALTALQSDSQVIVTTDPWITFQPADQTATTGLILLSRRPGRPTRLCTSRTRDCLARIPGRYRANAVKPGCFWIKSCCISH